MNKKTPEISRKKGFDFDRDRSLKSGTKTEAYLRPFVLMAHWRTTAFSWAPAIEARAPRTALAWTGTTTGALELRLTFCMARSHLGEKIEAMRHKGLIKQPELGTMLTRRLHHFESSPKCPKCTCVASLSFFRV